MLLLVFGMTFTGIRMYHQFNPAFALAIFPALCFGLFALLLLFIKKGLDLKAEEVLNQYKIHLETHKFDREWLNKELLNEQQFSQNKVGGKIHRRKKMIVEFYIQQLNVSAEEANLEILAQTKVAIQTMKEEMAQKLANSQMEYEAQIQKLEERLSQGPITLQQYLGSIKSNNSNELSASTKKINEAFSYIYRYIDNTLACKSTFMNWSILKCMFLSISLTQKWTKRLRNPFHRSMVFRKVIWERFCIIFL